MGSESGSDYVYDLRRIEDIFACLEIISIARGALFGVDPKLAARMEQVSNALGSFSQLVLEGGLDERHDVQEEEISFSNSVSPRSEESESGILDLTVDLPKSSGKSGGGSLAYSATKSSSDDDNSVVDIITGEKIR